MYVVGTRDKFTGSSRYIAGKTDARYISCASKVKTN